MKKKKKRKDTSGDKSTLVTFERRKDVERHVVKTRGEISARYCVRKYKSRTSCDVRFDVFQVIIGLRVAFTTFRCVRQI